MIRVLIVDDLKGWHSQWKKELEGRVEVVSATTLEEAEAEFQTNSDFAAIFMDACVPGVEPTTLELTSRIRQDFRGPMVAISSTPRYRRMLMDAGCTDECDKRDVSLMVRNLLGV